MRKHKSTLGKTDDDENEQEFLEALGDALKQLEYIHAKQENRRKRKELELNLNKMEPLRNVGSSKKLDVPISPFNVEHVEVKEIVSSDPPNNLLRKSQSNILISQTMNDDLREISHNTTIEASQIDRPHKMNHCTSAPGIREKEDLSHKLSQ